MTVLDHTDELDALDDDAVAEAADAAPPSPDGGGDDERAMVDLAPMVRPLLAAGLATTAAALVTGGIFGSWAARLVCVGAAWFGVGWAALSRRSPQRAGTYGLLLVPAAVGVALVLMVPFGGNPSALPTLVRDAIDAGRALRPPVPFDPGWVPILFVVLSGLAFGAARMATDGARQQAAIAVPLPLLALTAMTQPDDGQFVAGVGAFVPLVAALAVLFAGDRAKAATLTREFEAKRAVRGVALTVVAVLALFVLGRANVLFPEPAYDPTDRPQKPKPLPLSEIPDEVLFEIETSAPITGPWRTGVLDDYDGTAWRIPAFEEARLVTVPADGVLDPALAPRAEVEVRFTTRALRNATTLPGITTPAVVSVPAELADARFDPRTGVLRLVEGRVPADVTYAMSMPVYPGAEQLRLAGAPQGDFDSQVDIPSPPDVVAELLDAAPDAGWDRLDFVRERLRSVVVAEGGGVPVDITPERVAEILEGPDHEASPYEIVAAEVMLARWAGVPARIGFGFDGVNDEDGVLTIRPRNAAQWLEVYFEGHGWIPLIEAPDQAKQTLDNDETLFDPNTLAADEVAVALYVPIELESFTQLYQRIRAELLAVLPYAIALAIAYLAWPQVQRTYRRNKRRRWAEAIGPRAQVAVEYAELRDVAHDLNVGDPLDSPLEYLKLVQDDPQHQELAWLMARVMYGDLAEIADEEMARDAEELSATLRRRLSRGQPFQVRALAHLGKASLRDPYTDEVPNVVLLDPLGRFARWRRDRRVARRGRVRRRARRVRFPRLALVRR